MSKTDHHIDGVPNAGHATSFPVEKIGLLPRKKCALSSQKLCRKFVSVGVSPSLEKTVLKKLFKAISIAKGWSWQPSAQPRSRPCPVPRSQTIISQVVYFAVPGPHSEEIRRCILLFLYTLAATLSFSHDRSSDCLLVIYSPATGWVLSFSNGLHQVSKKKH